MICEIHFAVRGRLRGGVVPLAFASLFLLGPVPAYAQSTGQAEARVEHCIREAAGGRPWLERTLWGLRDQEGGWIGAEVRNTNGSHDLGPLQINSWWVPKIAALVDRPAADVRAWLQFNPCFNAGTASWIFLSALKVTGDYWAAVGVYHSPTRWRQRRYAWSVARHMRRRFGGDAFSVLGPTLNATHIGAGRSDTAQTTTPMVRVHGFGILQDPPS